MNRDDVSDPTNSDLFDQPTPITPQRVPALRPRTPRKDIPFMQRPTCTVNEACNAVGMGRTKLYELIKGGALKTTSVGRRRLVLVPSLLKFLKIDTQVSQDNEH